MDTNTVVEPLDELPSADQAFSEGPVVVLASADGDPDDPLGDDGAQDPREALIARSALWDAAVADRDEAAARRLLHPDFALEGLQPLRSVMTRAVWLEMMPDHVVHEWEVEDRLVDLDGDYASLLQRVRMRTTVLGEDRSGVVVVSDLWRCVQGEWLVWRRHLTPL